MALVILVSKEKNTKENKLERRNQKIMEKNHFGMSCFAASYSCLENPTDGEPGGPQSTGSQRVGHGWATSLHFNHVRGQGNGTPLLSSCLENPTDGGAWWAAVHEVAKSRTRLSDFTFTVHSHALEKAVATHSSALAWRIPWTEEPGGPQSTGSQRVGHVWATSLHFNHVRGQGNGNPLLSSCLENPTDGGAWWAAVHEVAKSRTRLSDFTFTVHSHALEKAVATHSSALAWRIPGTGSLVGCRPWGRTESDTAAATQQQLHSGHVRGPSQFLLWSSGNELTVGHNFYSSRGLGYQNLSVVF